MSASAKLEIQRREIPLRDFAEDICMCQGAGERRLVNGLSLYVCVNCGKATRERGVRVFDADRAFEAAQR